MWDISERQEIVASFSEAVKKEFPQIDQYNILVFGSFLTDHYTEESDIDIGILALTPGLTFRLYSYSKKYFDSLGIANDVVRMRLSDSQYINISIVLGQQYAVTDYCPDELIDYMKRMLLLYGDNPQETVVRNMREETIA